jgi:hypothetical protein
MRGTLHRSAGVLARFFVAFTTVPARAPGLLLLLVSLPWSPARSLAQTQTALVHVAFSNPIGPMKIGQMALGQGGLSDEPMFENRIAEVRALHPKIIRLFVQEYFDLLPAPHHYHFASLDRSVENILKTGATPLMCLCFKPRVLFPKIDQDIVEPTSYAQWDKLIFELVKHYKQRHAGIRFWEIANEPDIGEDGGCPYRFKPESYVRYYEHTVRAILRADPEARVGGPALAGCHSLILPALLNACQTNPIPLHFVSWHTYTSEPSSIRGTIDFVNGLLVGYSGPRPETILDEWNMDLMNPALDPRFQPCFVAEVIWQMKEAGLDYSCYYHIRDWHVSFERFGLFMSPKGTAFGTRWWNRMPQFDGLFDYQNQTRPTYFMFKLLSRLAGERLQLTSNQTAVHGFATHDDKLRMHNLLLWNFSWGSIPTEITLDGLARETRSRHITLDSTTASNDENLRLVPEPWGKLKPGTQRLTLNMEPYSVHYWSFE